MQCVRDRNESTVVFERRSVIARPVLGSMQNILTIHALAWQPKQMHTKSIRTVCPVKKPKKNRFRNVSLEIEHHNNLTRHTKISVSSMSVSSSKLM